MTEPSEMPFACNTGAMTPEQGRRYGVLREALRVTMDELVELPNGFAFPLPALPVALQMAAEFIALERLCCLFLSFALVVPAGAGPGRLELIGREGVKDFLRAELDDLIP